MERAGDDHMARIGVARLLAEAHHGALLAERETAGTGGDLQVLIDNTAAFTQAAQEHLPQTTQLLQSGEVDMVPTWNARAQTVTDAGGPVKISWNQGLYSIEGWGIAKGNPKAATAKRFVAYTANAKRQAAFTKHLAYGPTNPGAYKFIDAKTAAKLPTAPDNIATAIYLDEPFWVENLDKLNQRFNAWVAR